MRARPPLLDEAAVAAALGELGAGWHLRGRGAEAAFVATVTLPIEHVEPWRAAVAAAADALDHHPALSVDGGVVEVVCTTHVPKGLTALDVALASTIEALAAEYGGGLGDG